jgi:Mg2+ and Co2+ transporter CorA
MPISFLAGFFGMNFIDIPFGNPLVLGVALASMMLTPVVMFWWFRRQGWL